LFASETNQSVILTELLSEFQKRMLMDRIETWHEFSVDVFRLFSTNRSLSRKLWTELGSQWIRVNLFC